MRIGKTEIYKTEVLEIPVYAGFYVLSDLKIAILKKPHLIHRLMIQWCFGIKWVDYE